MRRLPYLILLFTTLYMAACALEQEPAATPEEGVRIVVLGSSTAAGAGPSHPDSAWVNRYRAYLQAEDSTHEVVNLARGGYSTYQIQPSGFTPAEGRPLPDTARNITKALSFEPDAIIINLPSNDAALEFTVEEQQANYERVMNEAHAAGVPVWITTTQPRNLAPEGRELLTAVRDWTHARFGLQTLDFWTEPANPDGTIRPEFDSGDGVHLNDAAHAIFAQRVVEAGIPVAVQ